MSVTIRWLVSSGMPECGFIAGESGKENVITGINIMDNPDTVRWLQKGELVLSTGYLLTSPELYSSLINRLYERGCSGFGIKLNRYIDTLPDEMITQANALGFPIFSIPFSKTMENIINIVYHEIFLSETSQVQKLSQAYRDVTTAATKPHGMKAMLKHISEYVGCPVFLTNECFYVLDYYIPDDSDIKFPFSAEKTAAEVFPEKEIKRIMEEQEERNVPVKSVHTDGRDFELFSVSVRDKIIGYLVCVEEKKAFTTREFDFIDGINSAVSVAIISNSFSADIEQNVWDRLLSGNVSNVHEAEALCIRSGFDFERKRICAAFEIPNYAMMTTAKKHSFERTFRGECDLVMSENSVKYHFIVYNSTLILFIMSDRDEDNQNTAAQKVYLLIEGLTEGLKKIRVSCLVGYSRSMRGAETISESYFQAVNALNVGKRLHSGSNIFSYQQDYAMHLLYKGYSTEELKSIYNEFIYPLKKYDESVNGELCKTITEYIKSKQNISTAAKNLFIHRNTMMYRLSQIEDILGLKLSSSDTIFRISMGLYIDRAID